MATMLAAPATGLLEAMITTEGLYKGRHVLLPTELLMSTEEESRLDMALDEMVSAARSMATSSAALTESLERLHDTFVEVNRRLDE